MSARTSTLSPPRMEFAALGSSTVRLIDGLHCPHCGRRQRACDVEHGEGEHDLRLICAGCHLTLLETEYPE